MRDWRHRLQQPRVGAALALAVAAAFLVWLLVGRGDGDSASKPSGPVAASEEDLRGLAADVDHDVFWAGPRPDRVYELTRTTDGSIYIRYLPEGVPIGDRTRTFLTIATYPQADALEAIQASARRAGNGTIRLERKGLAVFNRSRPTSVFLAYPNSDVQVEAYDPAPARARQLVAGGGVNPIP